MLLAFGSPIARRTRDFAVENSHAKRASSRNRKRKGLPYRFPDRVDPCDPPFPIAIASAELDTSPSRLRDRAIADSFENIISDGD